MVDWCFIIAGGGCLGFSFMLFIILNFFSDQLQSATNSQGMEWLYYTHFAGAVGGFILIVIGFFKKNPST